MHVHDRLARTEQTQCRPCCSVCIAIPQSLEYHTALSTKIQKVGLFEMNDFDGRILEFLAYWSDRTQKGNGDAGARQTQSFVNRDPTAAALDVAIIIKDNCVKPIASFVIAAQISAVPSWGLSPMSLVLQS